MTKTRQQLDQDKIDIKIMMTRQALASDCKEIHEWHGRALRGHIPLAKARREYVLGKMQILFEYINKLNEEIAAQHVQMSRLKSRLYSLTNRMVKMREEIKHE